MLTASAELTVQIEGVAQRVAGRLTIYLPASPYVDFTRALRSVQLIAQMTTDVPDGVRDVAGLSTLTGDIVVGGSVDPHGDATKTAEWLFNPDSPDSPLRHLTVNGCKITFEDGLYVDGSATPEFLPASGECWINGYDLDHEAGEVTFHVTSLGPEWDAQPGIGSVATMPPFNAGLTSEFVMDTVIRAMYGASSWPATRADAVLAAGMRGCAWAEVGTLTANNFTVPPTFADGAFGRALVGVNNAAYDVSAEMAGNFAWEGWVTGAGVTPALAVTLSDSGGGVSVQFKVSSAGLEILPAASSYLWSTAVDGNPHYVAFAAAWTGTSFRATLRLDGTSQDTGAMTVASRGTSAYDHELIVPQDGVTIEAVQSWPAPDITTVDWNDDFTPRAILDPSLNPMTVVPPFATDAKGWDLLQQAAGGELGYIRKDRDGIIRFSNRETLANQPVGRTIGQTSLLGLATSVPPSGAYRTVKVPYTEWDFADDPTAIYVLLGRKKIPAKSTVVWQQPVSSDSNALAAAIDATVTLLPDGHNPLDGGSYYRSSTDIHGAAAGPALTITARLVNSATLEISATNATRTDAFLTTPSSNTDFTAGSTSSGLWIGGYLATAGDEATVTRTYGDGVGTLPVASNVFLQDHDTAVDVGDWLLNQLFMDVRDYTNVTLVPDLRIDPGDLHRLDNPNPSGVDEYVSVWGWQFNAEYPPAGQPGGSREQTINVRALGAPDAWLIGGITDRGDINATAWLYV